MVYKRWNEKMSGDAKRCPQMKENTINSWHDIMIQQFERDLLAFSRKYFFLSICPLNRNVCRCDISKKCNLKNIVLSQHFGGLSWFWGGGGQTRADGEILSKNVLVQSLFVFDIDVGDCTQKVSWKWSNGVHRKEFLLECNSAFFLFQFKYFCFNATSAFKFPLV